MAQSNKRICVCLLLVALCVAIIVASIVAVVLTQKTDEQGQGQEEEGIDTNLPEALLRIHGHWSPWDTWSDCSATCGGGKQSRNKYCNDPAPSEGGRDCEGDEMQARTCAEWSCPDCSKICTSGALSSFCSFCSCPGTVLKGFLVEEYDLRTGQKNIKRVPNADIFIIGQEWEPTTTSDHMGNFAIENVCTEETFIAKKTGFLSKEFSFGGTEKVVMERLEKPHFVLHPLSQGAFEGQSVYLTCTAIAKPSVDHYEWYMDGTRMAGVEENGILKLTSLSADHAGVYACRAIYEAGNTFSNEATLTVVDDSKSDTCEIKPLEYYTKLPTSCFSIVNGMKTTNLDVGKCQDVQCTSKTDANSACCGSAQTEPVLISCNGFEYNLQKTTACGCTQCPDTNGGIDVTITAYVRDQSGRSLVGSQVAFLYNGTTSYASSGREYSLRVSAYVSEIALTFISGRYYSYMPTVKIIKIFPNKNNAFRVDLMAKGALEEISTDKNTTLNVSTKTKVTLPANAFTTENGEVYNGMANVYTTFSDPSSLESIQNAPGMFTFVDEEGYEQQLETFGVIGVTAETNNGQPLSINGDVQIEINPEQMNIQRTEDGGIDAFLWTLDQATGRWVLASPLAQSSSITHRTKRQAGSKADGSAPIPYPLPYLNIDKPIYQSGMCEVAIFTYIDDTFTRVSSNDQVTVFTKSLDDSTYLGVYTSSSNSNGKMCLSIPCGYRHEIAAKGYLTTPVMSTNHKLPSGYQFTNIDGNKVVIISPAASEITNGQGPVHLKSAETCETSSETSTYHFKIAYPYVPFGDLYPVEKLPNRKLSWYPRSTKNNSACFASVRILGDFENIEVMAASKFQTKDGEDYGVYRTSPRQFVAGEINREIKGEKLACVQVKCPEVQLVDIKTDTVYRNVSTYVDIQLIHPNKDQCFLNYTADANMYNSLIKFHSSTRSSISLTFDPAQYNYHRYLSYGQGTQEYAAKYGARRCMQGGQQDVAIFTCGNFEESEIPWWRPNQEVK